MICGIDPGLSGAIAFADGDKLIVVDMPTLALMRGGKNKREVDAHALARLLTAGNPLEYDADACRHAFVEGVHSMPGQGVSGVFALGKGYGIILGILSALAIPYTVVAPRRWKNALAVPAAKDGARARASQLLPHAANQWPLKKHDGRAEAALLALYGQRMAAKTAGAL